MFELKNIEQLPASAQGAVRIFCEQMLAIHGDNISCMVVYGSATGVNYKPGISDINTAVVFKTLDFDVFKKSLGLIGKAKKNRVTAPLFWTEEYIRNSLDVFPIEFNEIKHHHIITFGPDVFADLNIDAQHVRLLCEAQIKGKLLRVRQAYLESGGNSHIIRNICMDSLNSLIPVFRELLRLKGIQPVREKEELLKQLAAQFSLNTSALIAIYQDKSRAVLIHPSQAESHLKSYLDQLEQIALHLDRL